MLGLGLLMLLAAGPQKAAEGGACKATKECAAGLSCRVGTCAYVGAGETCQRSADCTSPLRCVQNACVSPKEAERAAAPASAPQAPSAPVAAPGPVAVPSGPSLPGAPLEESDDFLTPGPGKAEVVLRSQVPGQLISIVRYSVKELSIRIKRGRPLGNKNTCRTPCTLYVPPGNYVAYSRGEKIRSSSDEIFIKPDINHFDFRSPSPARLTWGIIGAVAGPIVGLLGTYGLISGIGYLSEPARPRSQGAVLIAAGTPLAIVGFVALGVGIRMISTAHTGYTEFPPDKPHLTLFPAPLPGGGALFGQLTW